MKNLKKRLKEGETLNGCWLNLGSPLTAEIVVAKMVRATGFGKNFDAYQQNATENILGIVQIETTEVLAHLDEIAALNGVDVLFIGPADLSMSLGIFGQFDHPLFKDALKKTIDAANKASKAVGILLFDPNDYSTYREMGIKFIACGSDATIEANGATSAAASLQAKRSDYIKTKQ